MATIITTNRVIKVNEDYETIVRYGLMTEWVEVTEDLSFRSLASNEMIERSREITLNTSNIIEVQP